MKKLIYIVALCLFSPGLLGQAPHSFNYQAVLRDAGGSILEDQNVAVTINLLRSSPDGIQVFTETHNTQTNAFGLVNLKVGSVSPLEGIDWSDDIYFMEILVNGTFMGSTQLLSVPYALHARSADESDPVFEASPSAGIESSDIGNWDEAHSWGDHSLENYLTEETDPLFEASSAAGIESSDIGNWDETHSWGDHSLENYLTEETDPLFETSSAAGIESSDISNWDEAHSWGDHSLENYLTEETDPIFEASPSAGIETLDIGNWDEAHSWGDHAQEGYLTNETQTLADVAALGNTVNTQLKNVTNPTDAQDAATKAYVDESVAEIYYSPWISFELDNWTASLTFFGQTRREYPIVVEQIDLDILNNGTVMVYARFPGTITRTQPLPIIGPILSNARDQVLNFHIRLGLIHIEFYNLIERDQDPGRFGSGNQYRYVIIPGNTQIQD